MKKLRYLTLILLLFFAIPAFADCTIMIAGKKVAAGCDPDTNEVGDRVDTYSDTNLVLDGYIKCEVYPADCTGTANTGFIYRVSISDTDNCKIGLCDSADGSTEHSPATHDANCVWSTGDTFTSKQEGWMTMTGDLGKSVTNGKYYWRCVMGGAGDCRVKYKASAGSKKTYSASGFTYASPPENLDGTWTETAERNRSAYVEIE